MFESYWNNDLGFVNSHRLQFERLYGNTFSDRLAFVHESTVDPNKVDAATIANLLQQCHRDTNRLPVWSLDTNGWNTSKYLEELDKHIDPDKYFVLLPDHRRDCDRVNAACWPFFLLTQQLEKNYQLDRPKTRRISFLSGVLRFYRLYLFDRIRSFINENDVVVINKFLPHNFINSVPHVLPDNVDIQGILNKLPWANHQSFFDTPTDSSCATFTESNEHPAFSACVNITGESSTGEDIMFISEKTWKAYRSGCLVINYGPDNLTDYLSSLGIQTWEDFDRNESIDAKVNTIVELFQRDDIEQLYAKNLEAVKYNQNLINDINFAKKIADPVMNKISALL